MSTFTLKLLAMAIMLVDHIGAILIPGNTDAYLLCRSIGRLAFPIFCFLLVEGFYHTSDVKKYMKRLAAFALISELPFDLAFSNRYVSWSFLRQQNVFFTLLIGLAVIYMMSKIEKRYANRTVIIGLLQGAAVISGSAAAILLVTDYSYMGILLIVALYIFRGNKVLLTLSLFFVTNFTGLPLEGLASLSVVFLLNYNGKKGRQGNKYFYYVFYPAHILCLYLISLLPVF